jgi:hypothetical protein
MRWPAALGALAVLAGCVAIPTGGDVVTTQISASDADDPLLSLPAPPAPDAGPAEIVAGFLRAGRGPQENYRVAREYLTDDFRSTWLPGARTLISSSPLTPEELADNTWSLTITSSASVDAQGRYSVSAPAESFELRFGLVTDDEGQWRISSAPDGTVLPPDRFSSIFDSYELYFFDPGFDFLVPELRWYRLGSGVANRVVDGLLMGPDDDAGEGVLVSAFPTGTERVDDVTITDGAATVPLSAAVGSGGVAAHRRMQQQLLQTLRSVTSLRETDLTANGFLVDVPEGGTPPESSYIVGSDPVAVVDGRLRVLTADGLNPLPGIGAGTVAQGARGGAVISDDRDAVALLTGEGVVLVQSGLDPVVLDARPGLVVPSLDPRGYVWSVPRDAPAGLRAIALDGTAVDVPGLPGGGSVVSVAVSRDGARLLVALDTARGPRLVVAGIQRDAQLAPIGLVALRDLPIGSAPIVDAAWVDGVTVVALVAGSLTTVEAFAIGGQHTSLGALDDGVAIVGGNGPDGTRVLDSEGNVLRPGGGTSWQDTGLDADALIDQL